LTLGGRVEQAANVSAGPAVVWVVWCDLAAVLMVGVTVAVAVEAFDDQAVAAVADRARALVTTGEIGVVIETHHKMKLRPKVLVVKNPTLPIETPEYILDLAMTHSTPDGKKINVIRMVHPKDVGVDIGKMKDAGYFKKAMIHELLVSGWPTYKIARQLNVKTRTVKSWLTRYPEMSRAVALAKQDSQKWRLEQLEQQFISAIAKSAEVLAAESVVVLDNDGNPMLDDFGNVLTIEPNAKLLGVQAQHARFIISLFMDKKIDVNLTIRDETPLVQAKADALDYLAKQLAELHLQGEPRETVVIVKDFKKEDGPLLSEDDEPRYGVLGVLDHGPDGFLCHICGERFVQLEIHIRTKHGISNDMYETTFMLAPGALRSAADKSSRDGGLGEKRPA